MDSGDGRYGWAADDPRWTDEQSAGRGRLEPPPPPVPRFSDQDAVTEILPARPAAFPPAPGGVRTGYGLSTGGGALQPAHAASPAPSPAPASRLERRAQLRARRRADDEFRAAGRAELFSDDARYSLLFGLTALWYAPVAVLFLVWTMLVEAGDGHMGARLLTGLVWLMASAAISVGVVGLLRWARVGWRGLTLTIAAALIGGGVATIAHTLAG